MFADGKVESIKARSAVDIYDDSDGEDEFPHKPTYHDEDVDDWY